MTPSYGKAKLGKEVGLGGRFKTNQLDIIKLLLKRPK